MKKLFLLVMVCLLARAGAQPARPEYWQGQSIYQIITDRFFDGDSSNDNADGNYNPRRSRSPHGGDFRGIEQKLDYVKALGATAIWISPVVENGHGEYHGYAGRDFLAVDPRWGTIADLRRMVDAAHQRGLLVIDDIVVNHGADLIDSSDPGYGAFRAPPDGYHLRYRNPTNTYPPPFALSAANPELTNLFHNNGLIHDYAVPQQVILGELSGLDDFRTESLYVREQMTRIYEYWIEQAGFDGFRIDTVKHVEPGFWQQWCPAVRAFAAAHGRPDFFMFGEVLDWSEKLCGSFTGEKGGGAFELDSVLDYPLYFKIQDVFARATASPSEIEQRYAALAENYDPLAQSRLVTFLDNHDQPRFLSAARASNRVDRLKLALVFLYTSRGIPCLYYGTEQAFNGGNDPYDREDMFAGAFKDRGQAGEDSFDMTHPLFRLVAMLNNFRRSYEPLRLGAHLNLYSETNGPGLLAYARRLGTNEALIALNTAAEPRTLPTVKTTFAEGAILVNLLDTNEVVHVGADGQWPSLSVAANGAKIFVKRNSWRPLDPGVVTVLPAHDARDVPTNSAVNITFNEPVDEAAVEREFSTDPPAQGTFAWSPTRDRMTFTPAMGFPGGTMIYVRVDDAAERFESRFRTVGGP